MRSDEVGELFSKIARRYDRANHVLSFNRDRVWRRELVKHAAPRPGDRILDLCTGTADVAIEFAKECPELQIIGLDLSPGMLQVAREKLVQLKLDQRIRLQEGNAADLPFAESSCEIVTMAFGLRNLPDRVRGLKEIYRVLAPGGRALILEFSLPQSLFVRSGYLIYLRFLLPWLAGQLAGEQAPYEYLRDSILSFPGRAHILEELHEVGFRPVGYRDLTQGIATLYWGGKANC
jgi:demethylmenaquinone methyltransferase/2-methoxy-6-polyprenyl-1,4-benzoquinol methylase